MYIIFPMHSYSAKLIFFVNQESLINVIHSVRRVSKLKVRKMLEKREALGLMKKNR